MKFIDLHCDTLMLSIKQNRDDVFDIPGSMLDVKRMKEGGALAQFFAIFFPPVGRYKDFFEEDITDEQYFEHLYTAYQNTLKNHGDYIAHANNAAEMLNNEKKGLMSGFLTFEDGRLIQGKLENIKKYYDMGIRLISFTWNEENCFGYPNSKEPELMKLGLKDFGKEAVSYMNDLGIIIDVSHLSDGGFKDVAELSKKPFVASHSNCRSLSPHQRNLTDEMVKILADKGGVAGVNFAPAFLNKDITVKESTLELLSLHLRKLMDLGGEDCAALGSDFDGITGNLEVSGVEKMNTIFDRLKKDGVSERVIEKIAYKNTLRVIEETMK